MTFQGDTLSINLNDLVRVLDITGDPARGPDLDHGSLKDEPYFSKYIGYIGKITDMLEPDLAKYPDSIHTIYWIEDKFTVREDQVEVLFTT
jgi:hypothetical protein